ncbi:FAD-dependent oxidoreductase [Chloroflexota bacterium]
MTQLNKLFEPITIGNIELANRLVMLGVGTHYGENDRVGKRLKNFILERAKGGVGLIFLGTIYPADLGQPEHGNLGIYDDSFIPSLRELTDAVHSYGTKVAAQILLRYQWRRGKNDPLEFVAPSEVVTGPGIHPPKALSIEEIHQIVEQFGEATRRAREAGFDAVDLCCIAGYLVNRFLSPQTNKRTDEYGGSLENRMRLLLEIIDCAREKAGEDYTLMSRLTIDDFMKDGHRLDDSKVVAGMLQNAGIDCLIMYAGWHECPVPTSQSSVPHGDFAYMAEELKNAVKIPVVATNRINDPVMAERIIAEGRADLVGMARALIVDPDLPNKAKRGDLEDIYPCISCNQCLDLALRGEPIICSVNPRAGREAQFSIRPATNPKKVFIVGGGPAGMTAATAAAQRGHQVMLFDRESKLGGQLIPASVSPYKEEMTKLKDYLIRKVRRSGAQIILGKEVTAELVRKESPDAIIVGSGASPIIPEISGVDRANVMTAIDVLLNQKGVGRRAIIVGGGMVGCETAEFLTKKGREVIVLERLKRIGNDIGLSTRWVVLKRLRETGVVMETGVEIVEVTAGGVRAIKSGSSEFFEGDTVVLAVGMETNNKLLNDLKSEFTNVYAIGDCIKPRMITEAVKEGLYMGIKI